MLTEKILFQNRGLAFYYPPRPPPRFGKRPHLFPVCFFCVTFLCLGVILMMKHENFNFFDIDQIICYCLKIVCNKTFLQECQMDHLPVSVHGRKVLWLHNLLAAPYMAASCPCICLCRLSMHLVCYTLSLALFFKPAKQPHLLSKRLDQCK